MRAGGGRARDSGLGRYALRVARAIDRRRVAAVLAATLLWSLGALFSPTLLHFFSPAEIFVAWAEHLAELAVVATLLTIGYTLLDEALPPLLPRRMLLLGAALLLLAALSTLLLHAYYAHGFRHLPPAMRLLADSLRWGLPALFLALVADVHRRALQLDSAAGAIERAHAAASRGASEQQLAVLEAQIEPHFLFNVLGNVRSLYRTQPQAGADAVASLMRYLRTALPQVRSTRGRLHDEVELVRSYLDLFQLRMGPRLGCSIAVDPALDDAEFPPMLLVTLVENAIKHGIAPAGGGRVAVSARRRRQRLEVVVEDDGAGFGAAASSGTGVGLANVRRQLAARYGPQGRLVLGARQPRGASATITIPLRAMPGHLSGGSSMAAV